MDPLKKLLLRILKDERFRYLAVGGWNTLFGYVLFVTLIWALGPSLKTLGNSSVGLIRWFGQEYYVIVGWIGWVIAVVQSTATMKYLVFRKPGNLWHQVFRAYFVYLPAQFIGTGILWVMVRLVGMSPQLGALATTATTTVISYIGHKYFTFRTPLEVGEVTPLIVEDS